MPYKTHQNREQPAITREKSPSKGGFCSFRAGCSDKKLLWRANLYVDERTDEDWNSAHPWVYGNEWNRYYFGLSRLDNSNIEPTESEYLEDLIEGNGKQVVRLQPFTYCPEVGEKNEQYAVAYSYGDNDNPFEYNDEMYQQMECIQSYHQAQVDEYCSQNSVTQSEIDIESLPEGNPIRESLNYLDYNNTTAPGGEGEYESYIYPSEMFGEDEKINTDDYSSLPSFLVGRDKSLPFPFLPGWNLNFFFAHGKPYSTPDWTNVISVGVDCVGLVQRAASYYFSDTDHNSYTWIDICGQDIFTRDNDTVREEDWFDDYRAYPTVEENLSVLIADSSQLNDSGEIANLNLIRPGDIFLKSGHIAIVNSVDDMDGDGIDVSEIGLIESTWGALEDWAKVVNNNTNPDNGSTLAFYSNRNWKIVRLR